MAPAHPKPKGKKGPARDKAKTKAIEFNDKEDIQRLRGQLGQLDPKAKFTRFSELPLCARTVAGLDQSHYKELTDIQAKSIPLALKGKDILGAAKTGSGKTLAFLIPVLEALFREQWSKHDGLGALIISPTRELAVQIFDVLRKIGRNHFPSAGLIEGGMDFQEEAERIPMMNIIVGTPGRLLQHLDNTHGFSVENLQVLVLDEADRILDMGFQSTVDAIIEHLPKMRQTMLFSATQTKKVSDLARLSLKDPEYVSVHEEATEATPNKLKQGYIVTPLPDKLDTLWSFIKANLKSKMIVFLSSSKQVRFVYECFRRMQPGITLLCLFGRKSQEARLKVTRGFMQAKHCCLIATDVVARGIDFPSVDWVVQVDCPEDADTYIHRVGRTARYESDGRAVLFLDPSEEDGMLRRLQQKKIPVEKMHVKASKQKSIRDRVQEMCFKEADLKYIAQKAFTYYAQSINHMKDKEVFQLSKLDLDGFAASMGLPGTPQVRLHKGTDIKKVKNAPRAGMSSDDEYNDDEERNPKKKAEVKTKYDRLFERTNQDVLSSHYNKVVEDGDQGPNSDDEEDFLKVKRVINNDELDQEEGDGPKVLTHLGPQPFVIDSKRREKMLKSKKKLLKFKGKGTKMYFDEEGDAHPVYELQNEDDFAKEGPAGELIKQYVVGEEARVREADIEDKAVSKEKRREKRLKRKLREAEERGDMVRRGADSGDRVVQLADTSGLHDDPLALLRSLPISGEEERSGDEGRDNGHSDGEEERPKKKAKKHKREKTKKKSKGIVELDEVPETLEDLEAVAAGLLD